MAVDDNGCQIAPDGTTTELDPPCETDPEPCYQKALRPVGNGLVGAAYDPFTGHFLYLNDNAGTLYFDGRAAYV